MKSRAQPDRRDDTEPNPVHDEEGVLPDPLDIDLMLARDVPKSEERNQEQRQQSNRFLMI